MSDTSKKLKPNSKEQTTKYIVANQQTELIIEYLKQLDPDTHKTNYYAVKNFYKAEKVKQTLKSVIDNRTDKTGDYYNILTKLQAKSGVLLDYYNDLISDGQLQLKKETYKLPNVDKTQELAHKYTEISKEYEAPAYLPIRQLMYGDKPQTGSKTITVTDYTITDEKALANELKTIDTITITLYRLEKTKTNLTKSSINGIDIDISDIQNKTDKLIDKLGLANSKRKKQIGYLWNMTIDRVLADILAEMHKRGSTTQNQLDNKTTTPVNIRLDYTGYTIPKPPIDSNIKDIENPNPDKAKTIGKMYRSNEEIKDENGLFATVTDPTLLDYLPAEYQDPIKLLALYNRSNRRGLVTLFRYLQDTPNPPDKIKLIDLAKHNGAYLEQIKKDGYLRDRYKKILLNELVLIKGTNTFYTYFDKSINKEMIGSIHFFNYDISTDGKIITGLRYSDEYIRVLHGKDKAMLHLATPKSLDTLSQPAQDIAYKIINLFIDKYQMSRTIQGKPIKVTVAKLYKGILTEPKDKRTRYQTKQTTLKLLDEILTIKQDNIIEKYELVENNYLLIYPSRFTKTAYKDKSLDTALKQAVKRQQLERVQDLQNLIKMYRNDFNRSDDKRNVNSYVAEDIGVTENEIKMYLVKPTKGKTIKPEPISDEVHDKIIECLRDYETENIK